MNDKQEKKIKHYSGTEKVRILKRCLVGKEPVSKVCEEVGLRPSLYYNWQQKFFDNGARAFEGEGGQEREERKWERKAAALEEKIRKKDAALSELMIEHIDLKKTLA